MGSLGSWEIVENMTTQVWLKKSSALRVQDSVKFVLSGLWVIENLFPMFLLGADVFLGGQKALSWNYKGTSLTIDSENATIISSIRFI